MTDLVQDDGTTPGSPTFLSQGFTIVVIRGLRERIDQLAVLLVSAL
jgi:hypothetical protein